MASNIYPGGGVRSGKKAQEECIFRRTNAFATHPEDWYPLKPEQVIYSPSVHIIKDISHDLLPKAKHCEIGLLTVPAIRKPRLQDGCYNTDDRLLMTAKIESIFNIAIRNGHDSLVLGAFGCGVFRNPPTEVASIFRDMLRTYASSFKRIGFAVLIVKPADKENLTTFQKILN
jgi:uncharacterized protein (TIGR02452 family)